MSVYTEQIGSYLLLEQLGSGGMAVVWRAWDQRKNRDVAVKAIKPEFQGDAHFINRFLDEARRQSRLDHPNIVKVLDTFSVGQQQCMVMQLIVGESLEDRLEQSPNHRLSVEQAIPIVHDILAALDYAHRNGVTHRDVKPSNILIERSSGRAFLADFGISLAVGELRRTRAGVPVGTSEYMSPEQIRDPLHIDHRSDVYSVGCVLYETLTGQPPFTAPDVNGNAWELAIRSAHIKSAPLAPHFRVESIPRELSKQVIWALEKNPELRLPGCAEFSRLLSQQISSTRTATGSIKKLWRAFAPPLGVGLLAGLLIYLILP